MWHDPEMSPPQEVWYEASIGALIAFLFKFSIAYLVVSILWVVLALIVVFVLGAIGIDLPSRL